MGGQGFTEPIRSGFGKVQASINAGNNANRVLGFRVCNIGKKLFV
jgi:hypothetical protein